MTENRVMRRWEINAPASVKLEGAEMFASCHLRDINLKGCCIVLSQKLEVDTFLKLHLCLNEDCSIYAEVWVVWHKTCAGANVYGLYFTEISEQAKEIIYHHIRRFFPHHLCPSHKDETASRLMPYEDKRIFARFNYSTPLHYLDMDDASEGDGQTTDISAKGVAFLTIGHMRVCAPLELWITIPHSNLPLYTRATVVWKSQANEQGMFRVGANLEKADLMAFSHVLRSTVDG